MKKVVFVLVVFIAGAQALGDVDITCVADGNEVTVSYEVSNEPNLVRIFTLDITVDNGAKIVKMPLSSFNQDYSIHPGSIIINEITGIIDDNGSPIADRSQYLQGSPAYDGTLPGIGSSGATIEVGSLYLDENDAPLWSADMFQFYVDKDCTVSIVENAIRKGVVLEDASKTFNFNSPGCSVVMSGCSTCLGDMNGDGWLSPSDVIDLVSALLPYQAEYYWVLAPPGSCGDINGDGWLSPEDVSALVSALLPYAADSYWKLCS